MDTDKSTLPGMDDKAVDSLQVQMPPTKPPISRIAKAVLEMDSAMHDHFGEIRHASRQIVEKAKVVLRDGNGYAAHLDPVVQQISKAAEELDELVLKAEQILAGHHGDENGG